MTHTPLKAERDHLTLLHTAARDPMSTARERATAQAQLADQLVWTGRTDPLNGDLPRLLADLDAAEAERDQFEERCRVLSADFLGAAAQRDRAESELDAERKMRVEAEAALDERDCDVHARIRAGYDTTVADLWRAKVAKVESERDALKAKLAAAESAHSELFLSGQVAELKAKLAALVAAVDTEIDNVDHENYPLCGVHDGSRLIGRHLNGAECTCGVQKIRNAIAAARGGAQ